MSNPSVPPDKNKFVSVKEAAKRVGYTPDHVTRIARENKIKSKMVGNERLVNIDSLKTFELESRAKQARREERLSRERHHERVFAEGHANGLAQNEPTYPSGYGSLARSIAVFAAVCALLGPAFFIRHNDVPAERMASALQHSLHRASALYAMHQDSGSYGGGQSAALADSVGSAFCNYFDGPFVERWLGVCIEGSYVVTDAPNEPSAPPSLAPSAWPVAEPAPVAVPEETIPRRDTSRVEPVAATNRTNFAYVTEERYLAHVGQVIGVLSALNPVLAALAPDTALVERIRDDITDLEDEMDDIDVRSERQSDKNREEVGDRIDGLDEDASFSGTFTLEDITGGVLVSDGTGLVSTTTLSAANITDDALDFAQLSDTMTVDATTAFDLDANNADLNFDAGTLMIDADTSRVGIGTTSPAALLHVAGDAIVGGSITASSFVTVGGSATSTFGALETIGDALIGGSLIVAGNSTVFGTTTTGTLAINSRINSDLVPDVNAMYDLGSAARFWDNAYIDTLTVNSISAASTTIAGTQSQTFTLNSDNATADTENVELIFYRGTVVPNALITWDAAADRFDSNQPFFIENDSADTSLATLALRAASGQTGDIFRAATSTGGTAFAISAAGTITDGVWNGTEIDIGDYTNLTVTAAGLQLSNDALALAAGYEIPLSASTTAWSTAYGWGDHSAAGYLDGTGAANRIAYFSDAGTLTSNAVLTFSSSGGFTTGTDFVGAGGSDITASNFGSFAGGYISGTGASDLTSSGQGSFAYGYANGSFSNEGEIISSGAGSVAMGRAGGSSDGLIQASGEGSVALGVSTGGTLTATGIGAFALGDNVNATANNAFALGRDVTTGVADTFALGFGGTQFFLEGSSGNVGIGTTTPSHRLTVWGTGEVAKLGDDTNTSTYLNFTNGRSYMGYDSDGYAVLQGGTGKGIQLNVNSSTVGSGAAVTIDMSGNVGIGDSSPASLLTVGDGDLFQVNSSGDIITQSVGVGALESEDFGDFTCDGTTCAVDTDALGSDEIADIYLLNTGDTAAGDYNFDSNTLVVDATNDRIGIGIATPESPLHLVHGSNMTTVRLQNTNASYSSSFGFRDENGANRAYLEWANSSYSSPFGSDSLALFTLNSDPLVFGTFNDEKMRITDTGNVGIGTSTPSTLLHVYGAEANPLVLERSTGDTSSVLFKNTEGEVYAGLSHAENFAIGPNLDLTSSPYLTILASNGNVGIGTSTPGERLQIDQAFAFHNGGDQILRFNSNSSGDLISNKPAAEIRVSDSGEYLGFGVSASDTSNPSVGQLVIKAGGNVGIGTTNPLADLKLSIAGGGIALDEDGGGNWVGIGEYNQMLAFSNSAIASSDPDMVLDADGNVGIGTTDPGALLQVAGSIYGGRNANQYISLTGDASSNSITGVSTAGNSKPLVIEADANSTAMQLRTASANSILFQPNSTTAMTIESGGNVGIGTTDPSSFLQIGDTTNTLGGTAGTDIDMLTLVADPATVGTESDSLNFTMERTGTGTDWKTAAHRIERIVDGTAYGYMQFGHNGQDLITFGEGTSEYLRIRGDGNIGIGTTNPNYLLSFGNTSGDKLAVYENGVGTMYGFGIASSRMYAKAGGSEIMTFENGGNVGIGTTNPGENLTVAGSMEIGTGHADYEHLRIGGGNSSGYLYGAFTTLADGIHLGYNYYNNNSTGIIPNTGGGTSRITTSFGYIALATGGVNTAPSEKVRIDVEGDVGIGTTNPTTDLQIGNSIYFNEGSGSIALGADIRLDANGVFSTGSSLFLNVDGDNTGAGGLVIGKGAHTNAATQLMVVENGGDVGIGRDPTANKLEIAGNASKSTAGDWLANSDRRIKDHILDAGGLEFIRKLRPVTFEYTPEYLALHPDIEDRTYYNFIAQEFAQVFEDAVQGSGEYLATGEEILQLDTHNAFIASIAAIKELDITLSDLATTTPFAELENDSFTKRFFGAFIAWFADTANGIGEMMANTFRASEELCINNTCIDEAELIQILGENGIGTDDADNEDDAGGDGGDADGGNDDGGNGDGGSAGDDGTDDGQTGGGDDQTGDSANDGDDPADSDTGGSDGGTDGDGTSDGGDEGATDGQTGDGDGSGDDPAKSGGQSGDSAGDGGGDDPATGDDEDGSDTDDGSDGGTDIGNDPSTSGGRSNDGDATGGQEGGSSGGDATGGGAESGTGI